MNQLKAAADILRGHIDDVVADKRADVTAAIGDRKAEILGSAYYAGATSGAQQSVIGRIDRVLTRLGGESQAAIILQMGSSFEQDDYPALLNQLVESQQGEGDDSPPRKPMVSVKSISVPGASGVLESEADVDAYLAKYRVALVAMLDDGKRITL